MGTRGRLAHLVAAACISALGSAGVASAQMTDPFKELEGARRDRLELDRRLAQDAAARRRKEEADRAARALAQRRNDNSVVAPASTSPIRPFSGQPGAPLAAEAAPVPPIASGSVPSEVATSDQASTPPTLDAGRSVSHPPPPDVTPPSGLPADQLGAPARPVAAAPIPPAPPRILITVDKAAQRMRVTVDGKLRHTWAVSTGRAQYETPSGVFRPLRLAREHYSREWDDAPMPYSIFFTSAGHAIHASNDTRRLGRRASHGCVRLAPAKAAALFALVRSHGAGATKVTITEGGSVRVARRSLSR